MVGDVAGIAAVEGAELGSGDTGDEGGLRFGLVRGGEDEIAGAGDDEGIGM